MMLGPAGRIQTAPSASMGDGLALGGGVATRRRLLLATGLLALAVGVALYAGLAGRRSSVASLPVRLHEGPSGKGLLGLPQAAQGPVSAALGADSAAYRVAAAQSGFMAVNPTQDLSSRFTSSGVSVSSGATRMGLSLAGVGYGSSLTAPGEAAPRARSNRVVYVYPGMTAWYANGPLGLEQGFTIARAPSGNAAGPLTLAMTLSGNVLASMQPHGLGITLSHGGAPALAYTGLAASDASGRPLHTWLQLQHGRLLLRVDVQGARFPVKIDPIFNHQGPKLTGSGSILLGESVALSGDGNTALIGAEYTASKAGAAWLFTRSGSTWTEKQKLTGGGESGAGWFGSSVALSSNGNVALVGGDEDEGEAGSVWVFERSSFGAAYSQVGIKLISGYSGKVNFGDSVALSADGKTALVGGDDANSIKGAVWVFTNFGSGFKVQELFTAGAGTPLFGESVSLSADGNTALVSGYGDESAWIFTRSGFGGSYTPSAQNPLQGKGDGGSLFGFE